MLGVCTKLRFWKIEGIITGNFSAIQFVIAYTGGVNILITGVKNFGATSFLVFV